MKNDGIEIKTKPCFCFFFLIQWLFFSVSWFYLLDGLYFGSKNMSLAQGNDKLEISSIMEVSLNKHSKQTSPKSNN